MKLEDYCWTMFFSCDCFSIFCTFVTMVTGYSCTLNVWGTFYVESLVIFCKYTCWLGSDFFCMSMIFATTGFIIWSPRSCKIYLLIPGLPTVTHLKFNFTVICQHSSPCCYLFSLGVMCNFCFIAEHIETTKYMGSYKCI